VRRSAALLRLLWMKRQLLSLHPLNQFLDPINRWLIRDAGRQETIVLDLPVEFDALVTHGSPFQAGDARPGRLWTDYKVNAVRFLRAANSKRNENGHRAGTTAPDRTPGAATAVGVLQAAAAEQAFPEVLGFAQWPPGDLLADGGATRKWIFHARDFHLRAAYSNETRMTSDLVLPSARAALRRSITKTERLRSANLLQTPRGPMCKPRQCGQEYGGPAGRRGIDPSLQPLPFAAIAGAVPYGRAAARRLGHALRLNPNSGRVYPACLALRSPVIKFFPESGNRGNEVEDWNGNWPKDRCNTCPTPLTTPPLIGQIANNR
jgi:hypothetical protein